ncbi:MAG: hypothetical protein WCD80_10095 [Desulfobaccales bacterium]
MRELLDKLKVLESRLSKEKGNFKLFALFLREEAEDKWDIVVSASWLESNNKESFNYLARELKSSITNQELLLISRIVVLDEGNPGLEAINRAFHVEHGLAEVRDSIFFGLQIKHAYIITSTREVPERITQSA